VLLQLSVLAKIQQIFMRGGGQWLRGHERWKVIGKNGRMEEDIAVPIRIIYRIRHA
jgi:hypothetical protein